MALDRRQLTALIGLLPILEAVKGCARSPRAKSLAELSELSTTADGLCIGYIPYYEIELRGGSDNRPTGFLIDVFNLFGENVKPPISPDGCKFIPLEWDTFAVALNNSVVDMSISGTFITDERKKSVDFTAPIFYLGNGAVVRKDATVLVSITDVNAFDRADLTIAVVSGEQSSEYVKSNFTRATILSLGGSDLTVAPLAVKLRKADVAMSDQFILRRFLQDEKSLVDVLEKKPFRILPIAWAFPKGLTTLAAEASEVIGEIVASEKFKDLRRRYPNIPFAEPPGFPS